MPTHRYTATVEWTGNTGRGTVDYRSYRRDHVVRIAGKPDLLGSSDLSPDRDIRRHHPDELLVVALSACHMLWYLHLCSTSGVVVTEFVDEATGTLEIGRDGSGRFTNATLHPRIRLAAGDPTLARELHHRAHERCFIANSVNFPVEVEPVIEVNAPAVPLPHPGSAAKRPQS